MKVGDVMTRNLRAVRSVDTVMEAAEVMRDFDVGAVPVFEGENEVGILTDRDIALRVAADGFDSSQMLVKFIMSENLVECSEEDDLNTAAEIMETHKVRRLLVRGESGKVTGIVTIGDLATRGERDLAEEVLERVSEPAHREEELTAREG